MISLARRCALAWWAFRNAERLLSHHFSMLRDAEMLRFRGRLLANKYGGRLTLYEVGRADAADKYARALADMPGAETNRRAALP